MLDKFKSTFREEAFELLTQLEDTLLELESQPLNGELINAAFRAIHTIKGSSSMFGYEAVSKFTHEVESVLDQCRNGELPITKDFIGLTLKARDHIRLLLDIEGSPGPQLAEDGESLLVRFREYAQGGSKPRPAKAPPAEPAAAAPQGGEALPSTYRVVFKPKPEIFKNGTRVLNLVEELAGLGQADLFPHIEAIPPLESLDPETCYCSWDAVLTTDKGPNAIRDVFIFVEDLADLHLEPVVDRAAEGSKRLGEILVERGAVSAEALRDALGSQKKLGEVLVEKNIVSKPQVESALVEQEHLKKVQERGDASVGSIRVASDKLDALVDLVGELVTLQARLSRTSFDLKDGPLSSIAEQYERLISQLRDNTMSIRMLPIGSTFNRFRRLVRDLSLELGKEAELVTEGAETELDKTVIEKLGDPLVHLIRNSLDHGIEMPAVREKAGKPRAGTIKLAAQHSGAYVLIQVSDDGKGLDRDAILAKGIERGIVAPGQDISEQEIYQLIFAAGFSTAKVVTQVSGRGVGMDVVKREIDSLGGTVNLDTAIGKGLTVTLKIPLTLAIIEGLLVRIDTEFYVVPLSSVDGCIEIPKVELADKGERRIISYRDELVPYVDLRGLFESGGEEPAIEQIVIASAQESRVGFVVDQVVGDYQTVIKPLGRMYKDVEGVSGATILGDGRVALILDVNRLAQVVQRDSQRRMAAAGAGGGER
jgi:two-component system chemotaxis sensor kinase CheA